MQFVLSHRHVARECAIAFAAWKGFSSPLRHTSVIGSCPVHPLADDAEHLLIWTVEAPDEDGALALLPPWLAARTEVEPVAEVAIP